MTVVRTAASNDGGSNGGVNLTMRSVIWSNDSMVVLLEDDEVLEHRQSLSTISIDGVQLGVRCHPPTVVALDAIEGGEDITSPQAVNKQLNCAAAD
ncbi:hypothetical protein F0562_009435 [Nyssa sinensis]|uniref:Uncharacterized protein n=1 Tax=Nyssa sinensis TaxID=561372 RepID=A0A5J4ZZX9_9ASTE|nr:hypothetical protein F0562_009435 [Nyssa sinensis]